MKPNFNYNWSLNNAKFTKDKGKVFSCFAGGGGSTMGYKLAGFDVIGCNEFDKKMNDIYIRNHHPKYNYNNDIRDLVKMAKSHNLPEELYHLTILDGSPPCSSFSIAGKRDKFWGKERKFREGQKKQILDTLFFDFIELGSILKPKIMIIENVKGLLMGKAKEYVKRIYKMLDESGYICMHKLLNSSTMGVPQRRERVFFIAVRKDYAPYIMKNHSFLDNEIKIELEYDEPPILYRDISDDEGNEFKGELIRNLWDNRIKGEKTLGNTNERINGKKTYYTSSYLYDDQVSPTLTGHTESIIPFHKPKYTSKNEVIKISSFPSDYDFGKVRPHYVCGMSVPPVMMANIASDVYNQILSKLPKDTDIEDDEE